MAQAQAVATLFAAHRDAGEPAPLFILSSPMRRCRATAAFTAEALGLALESDDRLIEIAHGDWEGRLRDELSANDPVRYAAWRSDPANVSFQGGESLRDVAARWEAFAAGLPRDGTDVLVCTHDAVIRVALLALQRRPLDDFWKVHAENGAFALIANDGQLTLLTECENAHLAGLRADPATQAL